MTFYLNGLRWKVRIINDDPISDDGENVVMGKTDFVKLEIVLDGRLDYVRFRRTAIHELTHAVAYSHSVNIEQATEEQIADFVGTYHDIIHELADLISHSLPQV